MKLYQFLYTAGSGSGVHASESRGFFLDCDENVIELAREKVSDCSAASEVLVVELATTGCMNAATGGVTRLVAYVKRGQPKTTYDTEVMVY